MKLQHQWQLGEMSVAENYIPNTEERRVATRFSDELKISGDGIFATLQGEGISAGRPSVFLRLQNCNLHCGRGGEGWRCDAWYTWDKSTKEYWQETRLASVQAVAEELNSTWASNFNKDNLIPNLVITGGEPLLQQSKLERLLPLVSNWQIEIETNGTINPSDIFRDSQLNCSPKLSTSGNKYKARINEKALRQIASFPNYWLKFVVTAPRDIEEIDSIVKLTNGGDYSRVILMSEGVTETELLQQDIYLYSVAKSLGCQVTARNHIFWYGDKRAT